MTKTITKAGNSNGFMKSATEPEMWSVLSAIVCAVVLMGFTPVAASDEPRPSFLPLIQQHYDKVLQHGRDTYGPDRTELWLASIDIRKGGQHLPADPAWKRTYREIHAPKGSTLYWEQPSVVAAYALSRLTGKERYAKASDAYLRDFLQRCVSPDNGLFLWGNHIYYDVFTDKVVTFEGGHHEARPLPVAWEMFWKISPAMTEKCIRQIGRLHVHDKASGEFDRHASVTSNEEPAADKKAMPFLEAGGIIAESLCWLAAKKGGDRELTDLALKVARYSFNQRGEKTGLLRNQPVDKRWDYFASTTEVGLWAGSLLRAAEYSDIEEFREMAREAVAAWLTYGFDAEAGRYFGQLNVETGAQQKPVRTTPYQPGEYADLWEPLFPTHNYPMSLAETCITLFEKTGEKVFQEAVTRWVSVIQKSTPANDGKGAYADQYGRCIHFLARASRVLNNPAWMEQAWKLAVEARDQLFVPEAGMFRSHPGEDRCDAVDGIGLLFLAMIYLETGSGPDLMGFGF